MGFVAATSAADSEHKDIDVIRTGKKDSSVHKLLGSD